MKAVDAVLSMVDRGDRAHRRRWLGAITVTILADFSLLYSQITALRQQRFGLDYGREAAIFVCALVLWTLGTKRLYALTRTGLVDGTRAQISRLAHRLQRLPADRFETLGRGALMMRLNGDTQQVAGATSAVVGGPQGVMRLAGGAVFAFSVAPELALLSTLAMALVGGAIAAQSRLMQQDFDRMAQDEVRLYDLLRGHVAGIVPIKLHHKRSAALERAVTAVSEGLRDLRTALFAVFFERHHASNAALYGILGINVFLLPLVMTTDGESIREINQILVWAVFSVIGIVFTLPELARASTAQARLDALESELGDEHLEPAADPAAIGRFDDFGQIAVKGLRFAYPSTPGRAGFEVGPIDLTFERGRIVFITGFNGSGKSTFLKAFTGLYPLADGQLEVDGRPVEPTEMTAWRTLFTTVFTHHHLFERAFGIDPAAAEARAPALFEELDIAHKTAIVDGRVTTRDLSAGQRKRLALVLARLQDRPVLVLDEWAADQDPEYRALYYTRILPALKAAGKLIIAVTHDDQYFHCADRLVHFDAGRLTDRPSWL